MACPVEHSGKDILGCLSSIACLWCGYLCLMITLKRLRHRRPVFYHLALTVLSDIQNWFALLMLSNQSHTWKLLVLEVRTQSLSSRPLGTLCFLRPFAQHELKWPRVIRQKSHMPQLLARGQILTERVHRFGASELFLDPSLQTLPSAAFALGRGDRCLNSLVALQGRNRTKT